MTEQPRYSLAMSDEEVARYRAMAAMARDTESQRWELAGIVEGARVVDLGCGPGLVTIELASVVGPGGSVVGVDREEEALERAAALVDEAGLSQVALRQGDAWDSGLPAASFDVVNIRHVLAHNSAEAQARILAHARELLRPGGHVYVVDVDLVGLHLDPPDETLREMNDRYVRHLQDAGRDPQAGPAVAERAAAAGFEVEHTWAEVVVPPKEAFVEARPPAWAAREAMVASGHADAGDLERWDAALVRFSRAAAAGEAVFSVPLHFVIGLA